MERCQEPLLIIAHQGILRLIYAYFVGIERDMAPHVSIPLNAVINLRPGTYSCSEVRELLHTKLAANSDGQAEPKNKRALSLMPGLSPAPLRPQLSDEKLSFETFSVDPSAHVERNSRSSSSRHASVQLLEATGGGIGTIEEGSHRVCEDTSPAAAVGEGNSSGEGGELPWLEDPPSH
mmetsp:Transcript_27323/g.68992  ORF Transcript_27323/g.68992 Transcript_27323/m.68992 type:complete len:178 (-) Transcript_27323:104-637(-)